MKKLGVWIVLLSAGFGVCSAQNQTTHNQTTQNQTGQDQTTQAASREKKVTPDVSLDVQVQTRSGEPVRELAQNQITLLEDGVRRPLTSFERIENGASLARVILVLDAVNVPYTALGSERGRLGDYLKKHPELPAPTTLAILTETGVQVLPGFSKSGKGVSESLRHADVALRLVNRSAGFYGASERLNDSLKGLGELVAASARPGGRTLLVFLSPGWPLLSGAEVQLSGKEQTGIFQTIVRLNTQMRTGQVTLYDVNGWGPDESVERFNYYKVFLKGIKQPSQAEFGDLGLQVISSQSGGISAPPSNDVGKALDQVYADTQAWYRIGFFPAPGEGENVYRSLKVESDGNSARTWQGFYLNPTIGAK